jgi:hypothetical protein
MNMSTTRDEITVILVEGEMSYANKQYQYLDGKMGIGHPYKFQYSDRFDYDFTINQGIRTLIKLTNASKNIERFYVANNVNLDYLFKMLELYGDPIFLSSSRDIKKLPASTCQIYNHQWKETIGFNSTYWDCSVCGIKKEDVQ